MRRASGLATLTLVVLVGLVGLVGYGQNAWAAPPWETPDAIICRGLSGVGFSYGWGDECWQGNGCTPDLSGGTGTCDGCNDGDGCNDCTASSGCCVGTVSCQHYGTWGADCSGFVSKAWQVPDPYPVDACGVPRYAASNFTVDTSYWSVVPLSELRPADAASKGSHVVLVIGYADAFGDHEVVEAEGCSYGIVHHQKTLGSVYNGARRINLELCQCTEGDSESRDCGDCGSQQRACGADCQWAPWTPCEGPDPAEETCVLEGEQGLCAAGERLCVAGWLTCQGPSPTTEVCDGKDNDCDGVVDNGTPETLGEGLPCYTHCGEGLSACIDGAVRCVRTGHTWPDDPCDATPIDDDPDHVAGAGGCSCKAAGRSSALPGATLFGLILLLVLLVRRRS